MWEEIMQIVISSGIWAILFCSLLAYQLKDGQKRELQYQETIERLSKGLEELTRAWDGIKRGIEEINRDIEMLKNQRVIGSRG
ncbi:MAG: BhlA/UviB family holin-like peptide [Firmicutes bacterium]|nr:BhlA/UviB family holin-like peptide [Bacillota bacterium]